MTIHAESELCREVHPCILKPENTVPTQVPARLFSQPSPVKKLSFRELIAY